MVAPQRGAVAKGLGFLFAPLFKYYVRNEPGSSTALQLRHFSSKVHAGYL
jgi:hypothetical protein